MNRVSGIIVLLTLALLLGACGKTAAPGEEVDASKVTGNIGAAHAGSIVRLTLLEWEAAPGAGDQLTIEAEVTESGDFSLDLPASVHEKYLKPLPDSAGADVCTSGLNARITAAEVFDLLRADEDFPYAEVWFGSEAVITETSERSSRMVFFYSDRALEAEVDCTDTDGNSTLVETMDASFKAGWNRLAVTWRMSEAAGHVTLNMDARSADKDPAGFSWHVTEN